MKATPLDMNQERTDLFAEHAIELYGLPPGWKPYHYECLPHPPQKRTTISLRGAVCDAKVTRGKRKGSTNWDKLDKDTLGTYTLSIAAHEQWLLGWERKTGKCHECQGSGDVMKSHSFATNVTVFRKCSRCSGTGTGTAPPPSAIVTPILT